MADDKKAKADKAAGATSSVADNNAKKALNRRDYLRNAGLTAAGAGAASIGFPAIARAQNKTYKLKLQSNWTGIGIEAQDKAAQLFVDRVKKLSGGRIEVTNFNAEVLLGIGETFRGVGSGVADLAVTSSIYHRGIVPVGEFLWAVPFFPITTLEFYEQIYHFMGVKELWQEAYKPHNVAHLTYMISDEWGAMVSTRPVEKYADFKGMKVRAFGIWADWLVHNGASIVTGILNVKGRDVGVYGHGFTLRAGSVGATMTICACEAVSGARRKRGAAAQAAAPANLPGPGASGLVSDGAAERMIRRCTEELWQKIRP